MTTMEQTPAATATATDTRTAWRQRLIDLDRTVSYIDPVVENDPPAPPHFQKRRPARRREGAGRQNAS
ncbi:MAG: hypothetical protein ABI779_01620 [Acidobacteriota bacterium]